MHNGYVWLKYTSGRAHAHRSDDGRVVSIVAMCWDKAGTWAVFPDRFDVAEAPRCKNCARTVLVRRGIEQAVAA